MTAGPAFALSSAHLKIVTAVAGLFTARTDNYAHVGFIRRFVRRKSYVAVNPVGYIFNRKRTYGRVKSAHRLEQFKRKGAETVMRLFISIFMGVKPRPLIVTAQFSQKIKYLFHYLLICSIKIYVT